MGEQSTMKSIMNIMKDNNAIGLGTVGIKLDDLGPQVKHLGINIGKDAEIDIMTTFCNGKTLNVVFGECKVIQMFEASPELVKRKVIESLNQALKGRCHLRFFFKLGHQTTQYLNFMDRFSGNKKVFGELKI